MLSQGGMRHPIDSIGRPVYKETALPTKLTLKQKFSNSLNIQSTANNKQNKIKMFKAIVVSASPVINDPSTLLTTETDPLQSSQ